MTPNAERPAPEDRPEARNIMFCEQDSALRGDLQGAMLAAALELAGAGIGVFPCKARGKAPLTTHGLRDATTDPAKVGAFFTNLPGANLAAAIPAALVVVDLDAEDAAARLAAEGRDLPATLTAATAKGRHLWYALPDRVASRNAVGIAPGVDLRGLGGYVVAPPSIHPTGAVYRWATTGRFDPDAISPAPAWLEELLATPAGSTAAATPADEWASLMAGPITEGARNHTAARVAGLLFRRLPAGAAWPLLVGWNATACRSIAAIESWPANPGRLPWPDRRRHGLPPATAE